MADSDDDKDFYDELDEDEDEVQNMGDFCVRDRLPAPVALQYTTRELHQLIADGIIDLTPPYQRGEFCHSNTRCQWLISVFQRSSGLMQNKADLSILYTATTMFHPSYSHKSRRTDTLSSDALTESRG